MAGPGRARCWRRRGHRHSSSARYAEAADDLWRWSRGEPDIEGPAPSGAGRNAPIIASLTSGRRTLPRQPARHAPTYAAALASMPALVRWPANPRQLARSVAGDNSRASNSGPSHSTARLCRDMDAPAAWGAYQRSAPHGSGAWRAADRVEDHDHSAPPNLSSSILEQDVRRLVEPFRPSRSPVQHPSHPIEFRWARSSGVIDLYDTFPALLRR